MKGALILSLILISLGWCQERIYVVQALGENLGMIDLGNGSINTDIADLGALANEIEFDGSKLYVTSSQNLQIISTVNHATLASIPLPGCTGTWASAHLSDDSIAVSCSIANTVHIIRRSTEQLVDTLKVETGPEGLLVHGDRLFVSMTRLNFPNYGPGVIFIYNRRTLAYEDSLSTGMNPQFMAIDPVGRLHVVCTGNYGDVPGEIDVFDLNSLSHVATVEIGGTPSTVVFDAANAYVPAGGWSDHGLVYRYRIQDLGIEHGFDNPIEVGLGASDIVIRNNGEFLVSCFQDDVIERRNSAGALLESYEMGDGPGYMVGMGTFTDLAEQLYVPKQFELLTAFPNPFNGEVTINFGGSRQYSDKLYIYNSLGQVVDILTFSGGTRSQGWSPSNIGLSGGNYWIKPIGYEREASVRITYLK